METLLSITMIVAGTMWIGLLLAAFFGKMLVSLLPKPYNKKYKETLEAEAVVLNIEETGLYIDNQPQVILQMQVKPGKGRNFIAEIKDAVNHIDLMELKAGCTVRVKYNPHNYRELSLLPFTNQQFPLAV